MKYCDFSSIKASAGKKSACPRGFKMILMQMDALQASSGTSNIAQRDFSPVGRAMRFNCGRMAGWLAGQATLECGVFCLSEREEWVRGRMPLMIAERKKEPPGSVLSLSLIPPPLVLPPTYSPTPILSPSLSLSLYLFLCVRTFTVPSLSP